MKDVRGPKALLLKTLERCRSMGSPRNNINNNSHSGVGGGEKPRPLPPEGCISVYVGEARDRFLVRTECVNHPLFRMLLDEAETEYGYSMPGPLVLPCSVDLFLKILSEMEQQEEDEEEEEEEEATSAASPLSCNFTRRLSGYHLLSPARPLALARAY